MVALAARCVEHVRPLFVAFWPAAPQQHSNAIDSAIRLAATSTKLGTTYVNDAAEAAQAAEEAAQAAADADTGVGTPSGPAFAAHVANAAAHAARAADAVSDGRKDLAVARVSDCLRAAANAAGAATKRDSVERFVDKFLAYAHRELLRLKRQSPEKATIAPTDRSSAPTTDDLAKLPLQTVVAYAGRRARSVAKHIDLEEEAPETRVRSSDLGWVLSLLDRFTDDRGVSEAELDRALAVAKALPRSVASEEGVEAANVIWHAVECMAAAARRPDDARTFLKWAADSAVVTDENLNSNAMTEEAWDHYDRLLKRVAIPEAHT